MEATMDDTSNTPPADQPATEHVCVGDTGTQLINIQPVQQTIRENASELENNGIETSVLELKTILPALDRPQISDHKTLDARASPPPQHLHIFDLPDELLMKVFEDVRGDFDWKGNEFPSGGIKGIKSLRLTCRRFCGASSHLLIHQLDVSLTASSLEHLDEVSCHPTISKGIKSLRICAPLYNPMIARSEQEFIGRVIGVLRENPWFDFEYIMIRTERYLQRLSETPGTASNETPELEPELLDTRTKRIDIASSYIEYSESENSQLDGNRTIASLRQAYEQHKQLFLEQGSLLEMKFVRRFATAVARLPTTVGLSITDRKGFELHPLSTALTDPIYESVRRRLLEPSDWVPEIIWRLNLRPLSLLYQLPLAVVATGNSLKELRIRLNPTIDHLVRIDEQQIRDLVSAAEHLKVLEIDCQLSRRLDLLSLGLASVSKLVSLLSSGTNLTSVRLSFGSCLGDHSRELLSLEPLIELLPWANLREISLADASFHCDELSKHLKKLMPGTYIYLEEVHLVSGLWADLLDVIRTKASSDSDVVEPSGTEDAELDCTFHEKFIAWDNRQSVVAAYIRGQVSDNPMLADEDDSEEDDSEEGDSEEDDSEEDDSEGDDSDQDN